MGPLSGYQFHNPAVDPGTELHRVSTDTLLKLFPVVGVDSYSCVDPACRDPGPPCMLLSVDRPIWLSGVCSWAEDAGRGPASFLFLQGRCLQRPQVPVPQIRVLQGPSARLWRVVAIPVGPRSPRAVPPSHATMALCVCPRVQILMASAATACLVSRAPIVSWTSMSVHPGPATMGPPAATWLIATSATALSAMQVMALAALGGLDCGSHQQLRVQTT
jgi:hypothetical protein